MFQTTTQGCFAGCDLYQHLGGKKKSDRRSVKNCYGSQGGTNRPRKMLQCVFGRFICWGSLEWMVYNSKKQKNIGENWGYPYLRKPPIFVSMQHCGGANLWTALKANQQDVPQLLPAKIRGQNQCKTGIHAMN